MRSSPGLTGRGADGTGAGTTWKALREQCRRVRQGAWMVEAPRSGTPHPEGFDLLAGFDRFGSTPRRTCPDRLPFFPRRTVPTRVLPNSRSAARGQRPHGRLVVVEHPTSCSPAASRRRACVRRVTVASIAMPLCDAPATRSIVNIHRRGRARPTLSHGDVPAATYARRTTRGELPAANYPRRTTRSDAPAATYPRRTTRSDAPSATHPRRRTREHLNETRRADASHRWAHGSCNRRSGTEV